MGCNFSPARSDSVFVTSRFAAFLLVALTGYFNVVQAQKVSLVVAVEDDAAPWSRPDGTGYANEIVVAAFKAVGVEVDLRVVPYARCKRMAVRGDSVACFSTSPSKDLEADLVLSAQPLFTVQVGYFYNVNKPPRAKSQDQLPPRTLVGTVIGYEYPEEFEMLKKAGRIVVEESNSEEINLKKLAAGRLDLALLTYNDLKSPAWLIERAGVGSTVKTTFLAGRENSYIAFSKTHPQGHWALEQFNKGHRRISSDGTLRRIHDNWLQKTSKKRTSTN
jgi:ABC-type amino acid transport substrate-binding protein